MVVILILIFFLLLIASFFSPKNIFGKKIIFYFFGILLIIVASFRGDGDFDYNGYVTFFNREDIFIIEPTFLLITFAIKFFLGANPLYMFIFYAIIGVSLKIIAIKQLTNLWFLSLVLYLSNFFILHEMTQIRAGVASAILLLCVKPIFDRDWKRFFFLSILAFLFHYSAIVILPFWFLNNKSVKMWLVFSVPIGYLLYFIGINFIIPIPIPGVQEKVFMYQKLRELESIDVKTTNVFNFVFLSRVLIFYLLLFKYSLLQKQNKYFPILIRIYCISLVSYLIFANIPAFSTRINELTGIVEIILIPFIYYIFKPFYFSKSIVVFIAFCFIMFALFYTKLIF